jgi:hypothetical protein
MIWSMTLMGRGSPIVACFLLLIIVVYQLFSGCLLNMRWRVWTTRKERPGLYWTVLGIEAAASVVGIYAATMAG